MSDAKEDVVGRKEPSTAPQTVSQPTSAERESAGSDIADLEIAWRSGHKYHVWSERELQNAYLVNLAGDVPTCNCEHGVHNRDSREACRHIKKAIAVLPSEPNIPANAYNDLVNVLQDVYRLRNELERLTTGVQADVQATQTGSGSAGGSTTADADAAADRLQDAYDDLIDDMQVMSSDGIVWVQTGKDTPEEWPYPGGDDTWTVLLKNPEKVQYVGEGGEEYDEHKWYSKKPGQYWKNALDPEDVDAYIDEVLG